jgi:hypothetical protein
MPYADIEKKRQSSREWYRAHGRTPESREKQRAYRKKTLQHQLAYLRMYRKKHPEKHAKYARDWRKKNPEAVRAIQRRANLKLKFGLTLEQYHLILDKQGGGCAICKQKPGKTRFPVDHDHSTGVIRGILCCCCNFAIEYFNTADKLKAAAKYLEIDLG